MKYSLIKNKIFKVAAVDTNYNSSGLKSHILISKEGEAWRVGASIINEKSENEIIMIEVNRFDIPKFESYGFDSPVKLPSPSRDIILEIWENIE